MLSRKFRLPSSIIFTNAHFFKDSVFSAKVQKNNLDYNRYGFIVAKTIDKRATVRNRLKRVFRSVIEQQWLEKGKGYDVLFILHPQIKDIERMQLEEKINNIFAKLSL